MRIILAFFLCLAACAGHNGGSNSSSSGPAFTAPQSCVPTDCGGQCGSMHYFPSLGMYLTVSVLDCGTISGQRCFDVQHAADSAYPAVNEMVCE